MSASVRSSDGETARVSSGSGGGIRELAQYYSSIDLELGGRFYDEIQNLIQKVRSDPKRYRIFDPPVR